MFTPSSSSQPKTTAAPPLKQTQTSLSNAFSKAPPTSRYAAPTSRAPLTSRAPPPPSHGPSLNTILQKTAATNIVRPKPRDRIIKAFECSSSFTENEPATRNSSSSVAAAGNRSPEIKSQLSALHDAVFFDEGDFDDDSDLNFDDSVVVEDSYTHSASPKSFRVPTPPLPRNMLPASMRRRSPTPVKRDHGCIDDQDVVRIDSSQQPPPPYSSAPFPWSSSPVENFIPPPRPAARIPPQPQQQQQQQQQQQVQRKQPEVIDLMDDEPEEMPKKKRKIPWAKDGAAPSTVPLSRTVKATAPKNIERAKTPRELPKLPWEMTATDVKRASRKNSEQRRGMSTMAAKGGEVEQKGPLKQGKLTLSTEQMHVLDLVLDSGKSVFFTGSAGTGKSVLMREVIAALRLKYPKDPDHPAVAVTASTGLAACNVGGVTLHSFAGIGLGKEAVPDLVKKIKRNPKAKKRWLQTKVLVIDEISMVDGELFDKLEGVARTIRNNGRPFGGIQLVVTGDFFQLPPVPDYGKVARFAFDANTWNTTIEHTIGLTQVFRQRDPEFAAILNEMRLGKLSQASVAVFRRLSRPLVYNDGIQPTELFPTRQEVDAANNSKMRLLSGTEKIFKSTDGGTMADSEHRTKLLSNCMAPQVITLKENSQVMLIKNIDDTLVNGSLGRVVGFMSEKTFDLVHDNDDDVVSHETISRVKSSINPNDTADNWPLVEFALPDGTCRQLLVQPETWKVELPSGEVQASRTQVPLILAWALSIHKAQGQTLERVKVDLGRVFEKGQAYVALSRATCQEGLEVLRFDATKVMAHEKVREFYKSLYSAAEAKAKKVDTRKRTVEEEPDEDEEEMMSMAC